MTTGEIVLAAILIFFWLYSVFDILKTTWNNDGCIKVGDILACIFILPLFSTILGPIRLIENISKIKVIEKDL